jgi:ubiquitin-protein ligase
MPSMPRALLVERLRNEIERARATTRHIILVEDANFERFPASLSVTLRGAPGPVRRAGQVEQTETHRLVIQITQEYPYRKPIVQWMSDIFHPNIMKYAEGGFVCTKLLEDWSWESTLADFLRGLEVLLQKPNPHSPYATCTCREAAAYFLRVEEDRGRT